MRHDDTSERNQNLVLLAVSPLIWVLHLLMSYITGAMWCGVVAGRDGSLNGARVAIAIYTAVALAGIGATFWIGFRRHSTGSAAVPHDFDSPPDRHRFLGFATLLLSGLSAVATLYSALAAFLIKDCH